MYTHSWAQPENHITQKDFKLPWEILNPHVNKCSYMKIKVNKFMFTYLPSKHFSHPLSHFYVLLAYHK